MAQRLLPLRLLPVMLLMLLLTAPRGAAAVPLAVTATVLSKNQCRFTTPTGTINFGNLDPGNPVDVTTTTTFTMRCQGSSPMATFAISDDDGLYASGPNANRMQHATLVGQFLPYSLSLNPITATVPRLVDQTLTVTATVRGIDYAPALAGAYADTVILSINP